MNNRTELFELLTPAKRRLRIADDVIARIRNGRIIPNTNFYFSDVNVASRNMVGQKGIDAIEHCEACAIGSMFISAAQLFNGVAEPVSLYVREHLTRTLHKSFDRYQLVLIEYAFEQEPVPTLEWEWTEEDKKFFDENAARLAAALNFGEKNNVEDDAYLRLLLIMENIIANNGEFVP